VPADGVRREPKGGKLPYSEQAWAQAQKPDAPLAVAKVEPKPEPVPRQSPKPGPRRSRKPSGGQGTRNGDKIDWAWPTSGKVIAGFNETSSKGVDLAGKPGDPVLAAAGAACLCRHGLARLWQTCHRQARQQFLSAYAHNQSLLVKEGQAVSKGQKIAELGDTDSDPPKLHFEIRRQGKPVDPGKYLPPR
jgi:lipoprotein NlpD